MKGTPQQNNALLHDTTREHTKAWIERRKWMHTLTCLCAPRDDNILFGQEVGHPKRGDKGCNGIDYELGKWSRYPPSTIYTNNSSGGKCTCAAASTVSMYPEWHPSPTEKKNLSAQDISRVWTELKVEIGIPPKRGRQWSCHPCCCSVYGQK